MNEKILQKLLNLNISGQEVENFLTRIGFEKRQGKGSHSMWFQKGFEPIVLARHGKEYKKGYLREIIRVLKAGGLI